MPVSGLQEDVASAGQGSLAATRWSVVLAAGGTSTAPSAAAWETLAKAYWPALYGFVRRRGYGHTDAEDLVQGFFGHLLTTSALRQATRDRGRFRTFLLCSLQNFLANAHDRASALKRGGGLSPASLDELPPGALEQLTEAEDSVSPEEAFDRAWANAVLRQALRRLEDEFTAAGKASQFTELRVFLVEPPAPGAYEAVAMRLGIRPRLMPTVVSRLRQRFRTLVRAEISHTVATVAEVDDELRYLLELVIRRGAD